MPQISLDWDTVRAAYPGRPLGVGGCYIGPRSNRRQNSSITTPAGTHNYLLAADEMKWFLEQNFGMGDEISTDDDGNRRSTQDMMDVLNGRTGILVFSNLRFGTHTELWDVDQMLQRDMSPGLFHAAKVLFWDVMITAEA